MTCLSGYASWLLISTFACTGTLLRNVTPIEKRSSGISAVPSSSVSPSVNRRRPSFPHTSLIQLQQERHGIRRWQRAPLRCRGPVLLDDGYQGCHSQDQPGLRFAVPSQLRGARRLSAQHYSARRHARRGLQADVGRARAGALLLRLRAQPGQGRAGLLGLRHDRPAGRRLPVRARASHQPRHVHSRQGDLRPCAGRRARLRRGGSRAPGGCRARGRVADRGAGEASVPRPAQFRPGRPPAGAGPAGRRGGAGAAPCRVGQSHVRRSPGRRRHRAGHRRAHLPARRVPGAHQRPGLLGRRGALGHRPGRPRGLPHGGGDQPRRRVLRSQRL